MALDDAVINEINIVLDKELLSPEVTSLDTIMFVMDWALDLVFVMIGLRVGVCFVHRCARIAELFAFVCFFMLP